MKIQKGIYKYVFLVFAVVILIADLCLVFMHDKPFSENENRMLQQFPEVTSRSALSGRLMTQAEDFVADQFFLRDQWISLKQNMDKGIGRKESNGVYLGKDGYLLEQAVTPNFTDLDRNLDAIRSFAKAHKDLPVVMSVVPNAVSVCSHLLPAGAPTRQQEEDIAYIRSKVEDVLTFVDVTDTLKEHNTEPIYFKSDHHWKSLGAMYAFETLAPSLGIEKPIKGEVTLNNTASGPSPAVSGYNVMTVTEDFSGTMASTSGDFNVKDSIEIFVPDVKDLEYVVEFADIQKKSATIYNSDALSTKDKYEVFLGGNYSFISIKTTVDSGKNLLLFKDSYANSFLQFLLPYYRNILIIDPRYYSDDCEKLIKEREVTDVLFLYNMNTFALDNSLAGVLED